MTIQHLLSKLRKGILLSFKKLEGSKEILPFQSALALQCFTNEYIYKVTEKEEKLLLKLVNNIKSKIKKGTYIDPIEIACIACYQKLYDFNIFKPDFFNSKIQLLIIEQIKNVQDEKEIEKEIYEVVNIKVAELRKKLTAIGVEPEQHDAYLSSVATPKESEWVVLRRKAESD